MAIIGSAGPERQFTLIAVDLPRIYAQRIAGPALLGDSWFGQLWSAVGPAAAWLALAVLAALVVTAATHLSAEPRRHALLAAAGSLVLLVVPLAIRGTTELSSMSGAGARYTYIPLLLAWVPLLLFADRRPGWARRVMLLLVLVVTIPSTGATVRSLGPDWHHGLSDARRECAAGAPTATVQIAPHTWHLTVECDRL